MKQLDHEEVIRAFSLKNKINLGIKETGDWDLHDVSQPNHCLFIGGMGSGKSNAAVSSAYAFLTSNTNGLVVVCDFYKGCVDFKRIPSDRVWLGDSQTGFIDGINFVYNEMLLRKKIIRQNGSKNFQDCDVLMSPILFILEESQGIQIQLEWDKLNSIDNTLANKLKMILKEGSNCGITVFAISQSFDSHYFPSSFLKFINHKRIFKLSLKSEELFRINHLLNYTDKYLSLKDGNLGRCVEESTEYQFVFLTDDFMKETMVSGKVNTIIDLPKEKQEKKETSFFTGKTFKDFIF